MLRDALFGICETERFMEKQELHILRHRLNLVGWGLLVYFLATQLLTMFVCFIPVVGTDDVLYTICSYVVFYLVAPVFLWLFIRRLPKGTSPAITLSRRAMLRTGAFCLGTVYLLNFFTLWVISFLETLTQRTTGNVLESAASAMPAWLYLVLIGVAAPVCEEYVFRRLLLDRLRPFGDRCAIAVCGVAFGLYHLNLYQFFYAAALGFVFAGVVLKTGKLRYGIALHATVNLGNYLLSLLGDGDVGVALLCGAILALCAGTVYWFFRYAKTFRYAPPQGSADTETVLKSLLYCPGVWACAALGMAASVAVAFLA